MWLVGLVWFGKEKIVLMRVDEKKKGWRESVRGAS
jgi:hypothetical protein